MKPLPSFLPPPEAISRRLELQSFFSAYTSLCARVETRVFKLERIQSYQEPGNPSFEAFVQGEVKRAIQLIPEARAVDGEMYTGLFKKGVQFLRVRAVELPLSQYLEWEFKTYKVTARYGESIQITDITDESHSSDLWNSSDFLLFDSIAALIHDYGTDGILTGGWIVEDRDFLDGLKVLANTFLAKSVPLAVFERQTLGELD